MRMAIYKDYSKFNQQMFGFVCSHLIAVNWENIYCLKEVDEKISFLNENAYLFGKHASLKLRVS